MKITEKEFTFKDKLINIFLPERCPYCTKVVPMGKLFCDECAGNYTGITYHTYARGGYLTVSAVPYVDKFADGIKRFKFNKGQQYAYQLAQLMANAIAREYKDEVFDCIGFVPLHQKKLSERGYNQSELLANELSGLLGIPAENLIKKTKNNQPQHSLKKAAERETNVRGVYRLADKNSAVNKRILLIDDIVTTGNTLGECARILTEGGAAKVLCATFAIAVTKTT